MDTSCRRNNSGAAHVFNCFESFVLPKRVFQHLLNELQHNRKIKCKQFQNILPACAQASLAFDVHENIPQAVMNIFTDPKYKGGAILGLPQSGVLRTPTAYEISLNYTWLLPMVKAYPTKEGTMVSFELHQ